MRLWEILAIIVLAIFIVGLVYKDATLILINCIPAVALLVWSYLEEGY